MSDLAVVGIPNGQFAENCWLLADPGRGEAVVVDPGEEGERILAVVASHGWRITGIWLTHGHLDHVLGVPAVRTASRAPVLLHPADRDLYDNVPEQARWFGLEADALPPPDAPLAHGQLLTVGRFGFTVAHTPGHSPGSVSFVGEGRIVGGDVLFAGSVGRTDLPGGDMRTLLDSIAQYFLPLPDATEVLAGHGPATTVGRERRGNPFLSALAWTA